jgi:hypothetical protein
MVPIPIGTISFINIRLTYKPESVTDRLVSRQEDWFSLFAEGE